MRINIGGFAQAKVHESETVDFLRDAGSLLHHFLWVLSNSRVSSIDLRIDDKVLDVWLQDEDSWRITWNRLEPESFEPVLEEFMCILSGLGERCASCLAIQDEWRIGPDYDSWFVRMQRMGAFLKTEHECVYVALILEHEHSEVEATRVARGGMLLIELESAESQEQALEMILKGDLRFS